MKGPVLGLCMWTLHQSDTQLRSANLTSEQEAQLENLDAELAIADKQLRLAQVRKQIAETELDVVGLRQTLQQQLSTEVSVVHQY